MEAFQFCQFLILPSTTPHPSGWKSNLNKEYRQYVFTELDYGPLKGGQYQLLE